LEIIDRILSLPEFIAEPPVLVEIGASGGTHRPWKALAPFSIGIAFDPDSREMQAVHNESAGYRRLHVFPAAAVPDETAAAEFHLTRSPYCSSLLRPDAAALGDWDFARLFDVERTTRVPCVSLAKALREVGVTRVDWFKTDSQGIDLRLFQSLPEAIRSRVLAVEFEPGIIDAYEGEDKLSAVLVAMDRPEFWLSDLRLRGTLRMSPDDALRLGGHESTRLVDVLRTSPGWGEMTYLNTFRGREPFSKRDWLLGWIISCVNEQFGFALDLARRAHAAVPDPLFGTLTAETERIIGEKLRIGRTAHRVKTAMQRLRSFGGRVLRQGMSRDDASKES
jgi:FkbM family methyltransferase